MHRKFYIAIFLAILASLMIIGWAAAQGGGRQVTDDEVNAVAKRLNCPVCENVPLDVCETQACAQWRDLIRLKLSQGQTPEQVMQYFRDTYGDRVLQSPPTSGFTWLLWVLPIVGLVAGLAIVFFVIKRMTSRPAQAAAGADTPVGPTPETDEYRERLERELKELL